MLSYPPNADPTIAGDFKRNDDVYDALENQNLGELLAQTERVARSLGDMSNECDILRSIIGQ